jgi:CRP-like cAMP-binding protein
MHYTIPFINEVPFTLEEKELLWNAVKIKPMKKRELLLMSTDVEQRFCFVHKGLLRKYYIQGGKQINTGFAVEGDIMFAGYSFFSQQQAGYYIEALEPVTILYFEKKDLDGLLLNGEKFLKFIWLLMARIFLYIEQWQKNFLSLDAGTRLSYFATNYPNLINRVPGVHLASYLNIQPETLSKLKKNYLVKSKSFVSPEC